MNRETILFFILMVGLALTTIGLVHIQFSAYILLVLFFIFHLGFFYYTSKSTSIKEAKKIITFLLTLYFVLIIINIVIELVFYKETLSEKLSGYFYGFVFFAFLYGLFYYLFKIAEKHKEFENMLIEIAKKRTPVSISLSEWKSRGGKSIWGIYVNDELVDFDSSLSGARSKAFIMLFLLENRGFEVKTQGKELEVKPRD